MADQIAAVVDGPTAPPGLRIDPAKDLWQNIAANVKEAVGEQSEQTVLVVGSKQSGKSTLINRMLNIATAPKPTTALEYSHGKREDRNKVQLAHFWELAGGTDLAQLADVVVTAENIHTIVFVIVVNCAEPATIFDTALYWLKRMDRRVNELFQKMKAKNSTTPDKMLQRHRKRIGEEHPDLEQLRLSGIPTVIIASRADALNTMDTSKVKLITRTLRFLAHLYGSALVFSSEAERDVAKYRALMNHLIFSIAFDPKHLQMDPEKGTVLVLGGKDSLKDIGPPTPVSLPGFRSTGDTQMDKWKMPMDDAFPARPEDSKAAAPDGNDEFAQFLVDNEAGAGEPIIDAMRRQKEDELENYRRQQQRKAAEKAAEKRDNAAAGASAE